MIKVFALGRLTADPELETLKVGDDKTADIVKFSIAVNEYRKVGDEKVKYTHFFNCEAWDSGARVIAEHCNKGDMLAIDGKLRQNRWENDEGKSRSRVIIRVENFTIASRSSKNDSGQNTNNESNDTQSDESAPF